MYYNFWETNLQKIVEKLCPGKLRFAQKCINGKWLYYVTKGVGSVYSVLKSSTGCLKVCGNDCARRSVQSGHMVAECVVKPLFAIICLMKRGALQLPILSPQHIAT